MQLLATIVGGAVIYGLIPYQKGLMVGKEAPLADKVIYNGIHRYIGAMKIKSPSLTCLDILNES